MPIYHVTKRLPRPLMGRALLEAGQFSHVPSDMIWSELYRDDLSHKVLVWRTKDYIRLCDPGYVIYHFGEVFSTLCPVCLTKVARPLEMFIQPNYGQYHNLMTTCLRPFRDDFFRLPVHEECEKVGYFLANCIWWSTNDEEEITALSHALDILKKRRTKVVRQFWQFIESRQPVQYRFNPRRNRGKIDNGRFAYQDDGSPLLLEICR